VSTGLAGSINSGAGKIAKRRLEQLQLVFERAATLLRTHREIENVGSELLALLGEALGCEWGTLWKVDSSAQRLKPVATWSAPDIQTARLAEHTINRALSLSEGTAGHVWRGRKPVWTRDLVRDMCLPRSLDAATAGLHGGIWFAIQTDSAVYGVVELLGTKIPAATQELLEGIETFGIRIGHLLEDQRQGADSESRRS
jgi:GAF domain